VKYIVLDIETMDASDASIELEQRFLKPNGNIKDEAKKEKNLREKAEALREKAALLDSSPIACVGIKAPTGIFSFCQFPFSFQEQVLFLQSGILCTTAQNEKEMLTSLQTFLNSQTTEETQVVTFNGKAFDLPKLRFRYAKSGFTLPEILKPGARNRQTDVMLLYSRYFTIKSNPYISLDEVAQQLGILEGGKVFSGAEVPEMLKDGKYTEVMLYNIIDSLLTERAYLMMSSQVGV
jgi:DNA polymerase elongation subunit (family B)